MNQPSAVTDVGDSFALPFRDHAWFGKMILQGLIAVIPIIGWIALTGWLMLAIDNFRSGRRELPPAGFHLGRGIGIFLVLLIYSIVFAIPGGIINGIGGAAHNAGLTGLGNLINLVLRLFLLFLSPAIILHTYRGGVSGGFDLSGIWQMVTSNTTNTLLAGLIIFVAQIIGGAGAILCLIGLLFTVPYAMAITAGVVTWYEQIIGGSRLPAGPPA